MTNQVNVINPNDASSDKWVLTFGGTRRKYSFFTKKVTGFNLPGCQTSGSDGPRNRSEVLADIEADSVTFNPIIFSFVVDENYENYRVIRDWMIDNVKKNVADREDVTVTLLTNQGKTQSVSMSFLNARPIDIADIELDSSGASPTLVCSMTLKYEWADFVNNELPL